MNIGYWEFKWEANYVLGMEKYVSMEGNTSSLAWPGSHNFAIAVVHLAMCDGKAVVVGYTLCTPIWPFDLQSLEGLTSCQNGLESGLFNTRSYWLNQEWLEIDPRSRESMLFSDMAMWLSQWGCSVVYIPELGVSNLGWLITDRFRFNSCDYYSAGSAKDVEMRSLDMARSVVAQGHSIWYRNAHRDLLDPVLNVDFQGFGVGIKDGALTSLNELELGLDIYDLSPLVPVSSEELLLMAGWDEVSVKFTLSWHIVMDILNEEGGMWRKAREEVGEEWAVALMLVYQFCYENLGLEVSNLSGLSGLGRIALEHWQSGFFGSSGVWGSLGEIAISGELYEIVAEANYGGALLRSQLWAEGPLYHFDVNSQYAAMMDSSLPSHIKAIGVVDGLFEGSDNVTIGKGDNKSEVPRKVYKESELKEVFGYVLATVVIEKCPTEALGVLQASASSTSWTNRVEMGEAVRLGPGSQGFGIFSGWYFSEELNMAEMLGAVVYSETAIEFYEARANELGLVNWAKWMYELSVEVNERSNELGPGRNVFNLWSAVIKRLQVSLVGVLDGSRGVSTVVLSRDEFNLFKSGGNEAEVDNPYGVAYKASQSYNQQCKVANLGYVIEGRTDDYFAVEVKSDVGALQGHIHISAAIRAYGRIQMAQVLKVVEEAGGSWYYVDTDGCIIDNDLAQVNPELCGEGLGQWKNAAPGGEIIQKAVFLAFKRYGYVTSSGKEHIVLGGLKRNSLDFNDLESAVREKVIVERMWGEWGEGELHVTGSVDDISGVPVVEEPVMWAMWSLVQLLKEEMGSLKKKVGKLYYSQFNVKKGVSKND